MIEASEPTEQAREACAELGRAIDHIGEAAWKEETAKIRKNGGLI